MTADLSAYTGCILAGGFGTRLLECVSDRPKVLASVAGRPFLYYILLQFSRAGIQQCVLCTGYLAEMIEKEYGSEFEGMNLIYSREDIPLGTGGALRNAMSFINTDKIIVANGDSFFDVNLLHAAEKFTLLACPAMLVLREVADAARYGRVKLDESGYITEFCEKDGMNTCGIINAGLYFFQKDVIMTIAVNEKVSLEHTVFTELVMKKSIAGSLFSGIFIDIGTPESYRQDLELALNFNRLVK